MVRVGLISDTHGLLRPAALAPVTAVRGNNDRAAWAAVLPETAVLEIGEVRIGVVHDLGAAAFDAAAGVQVIVSGHSHKPLVQERAGVLFVNPGSAGPRRFRLPIAVAELLVSGGSASARIELLEPRD